MEQFDVYVMQGISGSGKSTRARSLKKELENAGHTVKIVSADDFFMNRGVYEFDVTKLSEAHGECFRQALVAAQNGQKLIVDNTNTSAWEISPYMLLASAFKLKPVIIRMNAPLPLCVQRNTHGTPEKAIKGQEKRLGYSLPPFWEVREEKGY